MNWYKTVPASSAAIIPNVTQTKAYRDLERDENGAISDDYSSIGVGSARAAEVCAVFAALFVLSPKVRLMAATDHSSRQPVWQPSRPHRTHDRLTCIRLIWPDVFRFRSRHSRSPVSDGAARRRRRRAEGGEGPKLPLGGSHRPAPPSRPSVATRFWPLSHPSNSSC